MSLKDTRKSPPLLPPELIEQYIALQPPELQTKRFQERFFIEQQNYGKQFEIIDMLRSKSGLKSDPLNILDIGAGIGSFIYRAKLKGLNAIGVEPYLEQIRVVYEFFSSPGLPLLCANGEALPFHDETFDCVVSMSVLEHCQNIDSVLSEALRVLKKNGLFYLVFPNYHFIWEPHYDIFWPSFLPRFILKFLIRIKGRNPRFIDELKFTTPGMVRKRLSKYRITIEDLSLEAFKDRITHPEKIGVPMFSRLIKKIKQFGITPNANWLIRIGCYHPVIWLIQKK